MLLDGAYINLDRSTERRDSMEAQLRELGCDNWIRRFPAIDGSKGGPSDNSGENGIWACKKSHIDVLQSSDEHSALLVLEDDVELSRYFTSVVNQPTLSHFVDVNPDCDILFLDCVPMYEQTRFLLDLSDAQMKNRARCGATVPDRHVMSSIGIPDAHDNYAYCAASYVVTPKGNQTLRRLYAEQFDSITPVDMLFKHWMASGQIVAKLTVPFLATPAFRNESTIPYAHLQHTHVDQRQGLFLQAIRRLLFAGDHGVDLKTIDALIAQVQRSPEYDLGMKIYQNFHLPQ